MTNSSHIICYVLEHIRGNNEDPRCPHKRASGILFIVAALRCLLVHAVHAAHAGGSRGCGRFGLVGDQRLGGQHHGADRRGVLQRGTGDLGRIDDTGADHVAVNLLVGVEAVADLAAALDLLKHHAAVHTGVLGDLADRLLQRVDDDLHAGLLVALDLADELLDRGNGIDVGRAAAGDDALLDRRAGRVQTKI